MDETKVLLDPADLITDLDVACAIATPFTDNVPEPVRIRAQLQAVAPGLRARWVAEALDKLADLATGGRGWSERQLRGWADEFRAGKLMPPDPHERRRVLDHPAIATQQCTCWSVPEQHEGVLHDGRRFYFRYRSGWARLGLGHGLDAAVFDAMEGPTAEDRAWEYETATGGAFDSDAEASKVFDALLDRHLREDRS